MGAKFAGVFVSAGLLLLTTAGMVWPFRIAAIVIFLSAAEEMAITLTPTEWKTDVPSIWHAIQLTRQQNSNL